MAVPSRGQLPKERETPDRKVESQQLTVAATRPDPKWADEGDTEFFDQA